MRYEEPSEHCLCDTCSGQDCGQDNPEEYEREREKERVGIRQAEREKVLDEVVSIFARHNPDSLWEAREIVDTIRDWQELRKDGE